MKFTYRKDRNMNIIYTKSIGSIWGKIHKVHSNSLGVPERVESVDGVIGIEREGLDAASTLASLLKHLGYEGGPPMKILN